MIFYVVSFLWRFSITKWHYLISHEQQGYYLQIIITTFYCVMNLFLCATLSSSQECFILILFCFVLFCAIRSVAYCRYLCIFEYHYKHTPTSSCSSRCLSLNYRQNKFNCKFCKYFMICQEMSFVPDIGFKGDCTLEQNATVTKRPACDTGLLASHRDAKWSLMSVLLYTMLRCYICLL